MYLHLLDCPSTAIITKYRTVSMLGHYVLIHSVAENVFQDVPRTPLYTAKHKDFLVDKNVRLIHGWGKETDLNHLSIDQILKNESKTNSIFGYHWQHWDSKLWFGRQIQQRYPF